MVLVFLGASAAIFPSPARAQAPAITQQPQNQWAPAGTAAVFTVSATGKAPISYAWTFNGTNLSDGGRISGSATPTLTVSSLAGADSGAYQVFISNHQGTVTSAVARLSVTAFSEVNAGLVPLTLSAGAWGDYDNDGRLDLLLSGLGTNGLPVTRLYHNNGNGVFTMVDTALDPLYAGMVAWGDYDNDGYLDILANGVLSGNQGTTQIYRNQSRQTNGLFLRVANVPGGTIEANATFRQTLAAWGDYNNDGHLDALSTGAGGFLLRYDPAAKSFVQAGSSVPLTWQAGANWADFNNDGQLDLFMSGWNGYSAWYRGPDFAAQTVGGMEAGASAVGDFDNDGYVDLAVQGRFGTAILRNQAGTNFAVVASGLPGQEGCYDWVAWGDYDNDGYLDLLVAAPGSTRIYRNLGNGTFVDSGFSLPGVCLGMAAWGDYDGDGRLDILIVGQSGSGYIAKIFHNDGAIPNTPPGAPGGLNSTVTGGSGALTWSAATDAEQAGGLTYNVRIGTAPGACDVVSPMADATTGLRRLPSPGNAGSRLAWNISNLRPGTYYWSVQAIDNTFAGSGFAPEASFVLTAPLITNQPASQTVLIGGTALLSVGAGGTVPLAYQWFLGGNPLAGATQSTFSLGNVQTNDAGNYLVVVTNALGAVTSSIAVLTVPVPPAILQQPQDVIGLVGSNATFTAVVTGYGPMASQWFFEDVPLTNDARISGADSLSLTVSLLQSNDAGAYRLMLTNIAGVVTSQVARLTVLVPPSITSQPQSQSVLLGGSATFSVQAAGTSPLSYQWFLGGVPLAESGRVTGTAGPTLAVSSVQWADSGSYTVAVSNGVGIVVSLPVTLNVLAPPAIILQPGDHIAVRGTGVTLGAAVSGTPPLACQWQKDGQNLVDGGRFAGVNTPTLAITATETNDAGYYVLTVTNAYGAAASDPSLLTILVPPGIASQPAGQQAITGSNATFSVLAEGTAPLGYQWFFNGAALANDLRISGSASANLAISNAQPADAGSYTVAITNLAGAVTSTAALLVVLQPPAIVAQPTGRSVVPGLSAAFSVSASGTAPLSYQWRLNGTDLANATDSSLALAAVGLADFGDYQVVVSNAAGVVVSAPASLTFGAVAAWARNDYGQTVTPAGLSNVVALAGGTAHSLALRADGTVAGWGGNAWGQASPPSGLSNVVAIAAGANHSLALRSDGTVAAWGTSSGGATNVPVSLSNVVALAAGALHSVALRSDGIVVSWGTFTSGKVVAAPAGLRRVAAIAANGSFTLALGMDGTVTGWGDNLYGQTNIPAGLTNAVAIAAGGTHGVALRGDGTVIAWGNNIYGQTNVPPDATNVVAIAAGTYHNLALRADGKAIAWGYTNYAQNTVPAALANLAVVACGDGHNLALVGDGRPLLVRQPAGVAACTGRPLLLQAQAVGAAPLSYQWQRDGVVLPGATGATLSISSLALGDQGSYQVIVSNMLGVAVSLPAPVTVLDGVPPVVLSPLPAAQTNYYSGRVVLGLSIGGSGPLQYQWRFNGLNIDGATNAELVLDPLAMTNTGFYSLAVTNAFGSLVTGSDALKVVQVKVWGYAPYDAPPTVSNAVAISSSSSQYMVLRPDGKVTVWGPQTYNPAPPAWVSNVVAVAAGVYHFVVLRADGTVGVWGTSEPGTTNVPAGLNGVIAISAGYSYTLALRADGTVAAWGNSYYQGAVPAAATNVVGISAGYYHSLAVRGDGTIVGWGMNTAGEAGPPPGAGNTNFIAVAAGYYHNVALRADGTVVAWGQSRSGQTAVPAGLSNVVAVAAGMSHSAALRADGTVVVWGTYSQMPATVPAGFPTVSSIASGGDHTMALFGPRSPSVTIQPFNRTLFRGGDALFAAKVVGLQPVAYQWQYNGVPIPGATNDTLLLSGVQMDQSGAYQMVASNAWGTTATVKAKLFVTIPLAEALDTTNLVWTSTGSAPWYGEVDTAYDGVDAARSGGIGHSQESVLQTTVIGPGQVSWWWKVSSEPQFDTLQFKLAGVPQAVISGEVGWEQRSCLVPAGTQVLQWRYAKDSGISEGLDAGWVDQVQFVPDPPAITRQPFAQTVNMGASVLMPVAATGSPPLAYQWLLDSIPLPGATAATLSITNAGRRDSGSYTVLVSNGGGGILSSNAVLTVLVPQLLGVPALQPDGSLVLTSGDADGGMLAPADLANFEAQASTNLVDWTSLSGALSLTNGQLRLQDPEGTRYPLRLYRIIER